MQTVNGDEVVYDDSRWPPRVVVTCKPGVPYVEFVQADVIDFQKTFAKHRLNFDED